MDDAPGGHQRQGLMQAVDGAGAAHRAAGRGDRRDDGVVQCPRLRWRADRLIVGQHLGTDRHLAGQGMPCGHSQGAVLPLDGRPGGEIRVADRQPIDENVDLPPPQPPVRVAEADLPERHLTARIPGFERGHQVGQRRAASGLGEAEPERAVGLPGGRAGLGQRFAEPFIRRLPLVAQARAQGRKTHLPSCPLGQGPADLSFQRTDQPADPRLRQPEPLRSPPEMQLVGHGQERLNLRHVHRVTSAHALLASILAQIAVDARRRGRPAW